MKPTHALFLLLALCLLPASFLFANELLLDRHTIQQNETITITVVVEGAFAEEETIDVPVQNLRLLGEPRVAHEFVFSNGQTMRRKVYRFLAKPLDSGPALVGPLVLRGADGQVDTLAPQAVQVLPDRTSGSNDPQLVLRELLATGRDPFFLVAEADKTRVKVGEQVVVTWTLYNAATVQQWQITDVPKMPDFWSEEIDVRTMQPEQTWVGDVVMQRVPIRRVALFPLRGGRLRVGGMSVEGAILRRIRGGPFSSFEGSVVDVTYSSAPIVIDVDPLPSGAPVDVVGDYVLTCTKPWQANGGPVVIDVTMTGSGNVRSAATPAFAGSIAGDVQIEAGQVTVARDVERVAMARRWKVVIFPEREGTLAIPALTTRAFSPSTNERRTLRCEATTFNAQATAAPQTATKPPASHPDARKRWLPWIGAGLLVVAFVAIALPRLIRAIRLRATVRAIVAGTPSEIRQRVDELLRARRIDPAALLRDPRERGDAYRSLLSILEAVEHERGIEDGETEITRRVLDLLTIAP